jgi:hypothetical protein
MPSLQRFAPTIRGTHAGPFNDRCGSVTYSERCDFLWVKNGSGRASYFPAQNSKAFSRV